MSKNVSGATNHETLVFERVFHAAPERVFDALADVEKRARWGTPSDTAALVYSKSEFKAGGCDEFRCGAKDDLRYAGCVRYFEIVPNERVIFVESISTDGSLLSVSLVTWEIGPHRDGARVVITDQLASFGGAGMVTGTQMGMTAALDNLARHLAS